MYEYFSLWLFKDILKKHAYLFFYWKRIILPVW
jgi:hypothetical protein